jgi:YD repeat-containing protein
MSRPQAQTVALPNGGSVALAAGTWTYGYNAFGQRATKWDSNTLTTRRY